MLLALLLLSPPDDVMFQPATEKAEVDRLVERVTNDLYRLTIRYALGCTNSCASIALACHITREALLSG